MAESPVRAQGNTRDAIREFFATERRNAERIEKFNRGLTDDDELPPYVHQDYPKALYPLEYPDEEPVVVKDAQEERRWLAQGYYATLAEQQTAREAFEADIGEPDSEESVSVEVGTAQPQRGAGGRFQKKSAS